MALAPPKPAPADGRLEPRLRHQMALSGLQVGTPPRLRAMIGHRIAGRRSCGSRDRLLADRKAGMRHSAHAPELAYDVASGLVHGCYPAPSCNLGPVPDAGSIRPAKLRDHGRRDGPVRMRRCHWRLDADDFAAMFV